MDPLENVIRLLKRIYGEEIGTRAVERICSLIEYQFKRNQKRSEYFSQEDVVLITYGDSLVKEGELPLKTLYKFAHRYFKGTFSTIHLLPFFPWSSDDGFSVKDFNCINPNLGSWEDVTAIGNDFNLMFDYVVNHFSSESQWFANFLADQEGFKEFAITVDPSSDLSMVTRPRSLPLLTEFKKEDGSRVHLWTTFSADQIDFNYKSIDVLEKMMEVLFLYVEHGARILRLDAIAYLWKEFGTSCIHLPQTHDMVKLIRAALNVVAPDVIILTETNVPHQENISYFGNGDDEAQMVYNFTLPPLLLYTFFKQDTRLLSEWASALDSASDATTFFNFTASHDGIGVRPLEGILPPDELVALIDVVRSGGGHVSFKSNPDGTESPYELNITYVDAILAGTASASYKKFLASQSIQYALPGVPATYIHSLLGSRNWYEGVKLTGRPRSINREKLTVSRVEADLRDSSSLRSKIFFPYRHLIQTRRKQKTFHPNAEFDIIQVDPRLFVIKRMIADQALFAMTNISNQPVRTKLTDSDALDKMIDVLTGESIVTRKIHLEPYQYVWLTTIT